MPCPRYNLYTAASVSGNIQTGTSTGEAIKTIDSIAAESLPLSMKADWTELMFMQKRVGDTSIYVFFLAIVSVFLALSALYESWSLPLAVILVVPLCLLCSVAGVLFTQRDVNIFVQIGLVVLVGLACKNAILVVEYAKQLHLRGPLGVRGHEGSLAAAAAADPHDLVRLHLRSHSLDDRFGGRGGDAPLAGGRRLQRHVRRDACSASSSRRCSSTSLSGWASRGCSLPPLPDGLSPASWGAPWAWRAASCWANSASCCFPGRPLVGARAGVLVVLAILEIQRKNQARRPAGSGQDLLLPLPLLESDGGPQP